ncbi:MAG TPA: hypothetical protein VK608_13525 [Edaphobacter sp.]|nr:hypothetical protein [Edaphobacter sp.]
MALVQIAKFHAVRRREVGQSWEFTAISEHRRLEFVELKGAKKLFAPEPLLRRSRENQPIADRQFEIEFPDSGIEVFSFTFG